MRITIHLKDPDGVEDSLASAAKESVRGLDVSPGERTDLIESRTEENRDAVKKWVKYGEYVSIEIDTEAGTAKVLPA